MIHQFLSNNYTYIVTAIATKSILLDYAYWYIKYIIDKSVLWPTSINRLRRKQTSQSFTWWTNYIQNGPCKKSSIYFGMFVSIKLTLMHPKMDQYQKRMILTTKNIACLKVFFLLSIYDHWMKDKKQQKEKI